MTDPDPRYPIRLLAPAIGAALRGPASDTPTGLAWRIKQIQRQDWPTTLAEDGLIKRGYTPRQTLRLLAALSLLDAGLGPTQAAGTASDNENAILAVMAGAMTGHGTARRLLALVRPRIIDGGTAGAGEEDALLVEPVDPEQFGELISRGEPGPAWLIIDVAAQCAAMLERLAPDAAALGTFSDVMQDGIRETLAGRGHVPTARPRGDRYRTRNPERRSE